MLYNFFILRECFEKIAVDWLGIPWAIHITAAHIADTTGGYELVAKMKGKSSRLHTLKADNGYKDLFMEDVKREYRWIVEIVQKPESAKGFVPAGGRWVVERSYGWLNFKRRLSRDFEKTIESSGDYAQIRFH